MEIGTLTATQGNILLAIFLVESSAGVLMWKWLAVTGSTDDISLSKKQRIRAYILVLALLILFVLTVALGGILSHFDRPWYAVQGIIRDGWELSPAHYYIFFVCYPGYIFFGGGIYIVLKNWLPDLLRTLRWSLAITIAIPFLFLPAIDGNLLDQNLTTNEMLYILFYWVVTFVWIGVGIAPIGYSMIKHLMSEFSS